MSVGENVTFGLRVRGVERKMREEVMHEMLDIVDLHDKKDSAIHELSGGQKQRVGLARALAIAPKLLLLDEPLCNIDQSTKKDVATNLKRLFQRLSIPVILVTHNSEDAIFLAEDVAIMIDGCIEQKGSLSEVETNPKTELIGRLLHPFA
jgi:ABC-type Fe3+/spermidine/putrescine transport system ATPase subunit